MKNRVYTRAFKEKAVRLSHNPSTTIRQLAIDLGIKPARLYAWRRLMTRSICRLCATVTRSTEIRLLRKQGQKQQLQIEILQKSQQKVLHTNAQKYQLNKGELVSYPN